MTQTELLAIFQKHLRQSEQKRKYHQQFTRAEEQHVMRVVAQVLEQPQQAEQWILQQFTHEQRP